MTAVPDRQRHPWNEGFEWHDRPGPFRRLGADQVRHYDREGYLVFDDLLAADLRARITAELDGFVDGSHPCARTAIDTDALTVSAKLTSRSPTLRALARCDAILDLCNDLLGPDVNLYWDQAVYKAPGKQHLPWHQDNGYGFVEPQQYLTVWLALTDATAENGCPWVVPGLHRFGTLSHAWAGSLGQQCLVDPAGAVQVPVRAGGAVVFSSLTPHLTGANTTTAVRKTYILQYAPAGAVLLVGDPLAGPPRARLPADGPDDQYAVLRAGTPVRQGAG